jgi:hypothetical protein
MTVFGWPGSVIKVFREGKELGAGKAARQHVPPVPSGKSVKGFIGWMNRKTEQ